MLTLQRGNHNIIRGVGPEKTVITGDLLITGNSNRVSDLTVLGEVIVRGNENSLRDVDSRGVKGDWGKGNDP